MENRRSEPSVGGGANREDAGMTTSAQSSLCNVRLAVLLVVFLTASSLSAQVVTVTIQGRVYDTTGAAISQANVSVTNPATGFSRSATASATGDYQISALPVGDYTVTAEKSGFQKQAKRVHLDIGASGNVDFNLAVGKIGQEVKSQEAVEEFRVVNSSYSTEFGRAVGGIVNIITKSGTNSLHGSVYEYFRNDAMDARSPLAAKGFNKLRQNQFGGTLGGPIKKDKTFFFANYEGQRHVESPFYNSTVLANIGAINNVKKNIWGLPAENLFVTRSINYDNGLVKLNHNLSDRESLFVRYFINDQRATNLSPLNDGFDLPSGFKNNFFRDQSVVGNLVSTASPSLVNELRLQYAHRFFDFPTTSTQPHMEVSNVFTLGVNRGNPDFYEEGRFELVDSVTKTLGKHTFSFGGDFNRLSTTESFPLFYPFEADFANLHAFLGDAQDFVSQAFGQPSPHPFVIFFERFDAASGFNEPTLDTSVYQGKAISSAVRNQAKGTDRKSVV